MPTSGFKGFFFNEEGQLICRDYIYTMGETAIYTEPISLCHAGFHFCQNIANVFKYYSSHQYFRKYKIIYCKVECPDDAEVITEDDKSVTNKLKIVEFLDGEYQDRDREIIARFKMGYLHSDNSWALKTSTGVYYYKFGIRHRDDGPAFLSNNGDYEYYRYGLLHKDNNVPAVKCGNRYSYYVNNLLHNDKGPAIEDENIELYYQHGTRIEHPTKRNRKQVALEIRDNLAAVTTVATGTLAVSLLVSGRFKKDSSVIAALSSIAFLALGAMSAHIASKIN